MDEMAPFSYRSALNISLEKGYKEISELLSSHGAANIDQS